MLGFSAVLGPILAGIIIDADLFGLSWRAVFLINIVIGVTAFAVSVRVLPRSTGDSQVRVDGPGSLALGLTMLGLLSGLIEGSANGWGALAIALVAGGLLSGAAFWLRQRRAKAPLLEPSLLRNRGFTAGLVLGVVFFAAVAGILYVISIYLQRGMGYSPARASIGLAPIAAGIVVASIASHRLIAALGRRLALAGILITAAGVAVPLTLVELDGTDISQGALIAPLALIGIGMGTCFGTIYDVTIGDIGPHEAGTASGALSSVQQLANAIGAAAVTTIYFAVLDVNHQATAMSSTLIVVLAATVACAGSRGCCPHTHPTTTTDELHAVSAARGCTRLCRERIRYW